MHANESNEIKKKIDECCLTADFCGECQESKCPVGFMREVYEGKLDKNHYETCDINLLRQGVEVAIFKGSLEYPGNVKNYLDDLSGSVPELVEVLKGKLRRI